MPESVPIEGKFTLRGVPALKVGILLTVIIGGITPITVATLTIVQGPLSVALVFGVLIILIFLAFRFLNKDIKASNKGRGGR